MNIFTSCYQVAAHLDSSRYLVVSISRFPPKNFSGVVWKLFAPSASLLRKYKQGLSESDYIQSFRSQIDDLGELRSQFVPLALKAHGRDIVLCCYERDGLFCHRHVLADMVLEKYGYQIVEL